jgi:predicted GIY-YIG superfamily endonuclease
LSENVYNIQSIIMVSIYVLKLKNNKYYVGKTTNPTYRLKDHFSEGGSAWSKKYKPITVHELRPDCSDSDEQIVTQEYMKKYGIENVRGGPWCQVSLPTETLKFIQHIIQANDDKCYKCGKTGHFASNCWSKKTTKKYSKPAINKCIRCGRKGHYVDNCYAETDVNGYFIESESSEEEYYSDVTCYRCGRKGHIKTDCYASKHVRGYNLT